MNEYIVCIDFGGRARNYPIKAMSEEEAINIAMQEHPDGRDFIIYNPDEYED